MTFTGTVRDQHGAVAEMTLEHYPGMTEAELSRIEAEANARWPLQASLIVHRIGTLKPGDNIVLVMTASEHRDAAFDAAKFLMDYLKTGAPFWKRELGASGTRWVEARPATTMRPSRWTETRRGVGFALRSLLLSLPGLTEQPSKFRHCQAGAGVFPEKSGIECDWHR